VSWRLEVVSALLSIGQLGLCLSARVMQSRQNVCLQLAVVTGSTSADWQIAHVCDVSSGHHLGHV